MLTNARKTYIIVIKMQNVRIDMDHSRAPVKMDSVAMVYCVEVCHLFCISQ